MNLSVNLASPIYKNYVAVNNNNIKKSNNSPHFEGKRISKTTLRDAGLAIAAGLLIGLNSCRETNRASISEAENNNIITKVINYSPTQQEISKFEEKIDLPSEKTINIWAGKYSYLETVKDRFLGIHEFDMNGYATKEYNNNGDIAYEFSHHKEHLVDVKKYFYENNKLTKTQKYIFDSNNKIAGVKEEHFQDFRSEIINYDSKGVLSSYNIEEFYSNGSSKMKRLAMKDENGVLHIIETMFDTKEREIVSAKYNYKNGKITDYQIIKNLYNNDDQKILEEETVAHPDSNNYQYVHSHQYEYDVDGNLKERNCNINISDNTGILEDIHSIESF